MNIDHIFIFSNDQGNVVEKLINFGLVEGSNRIHDGQGTSNRKFYFYNFFLEIVWVHDPTEIKSDLIKPTGLWQRAEFDVNGFSPFGLCIVHTNETNQTFQNSYAYQPKYFSSGMVIDILKNENQPSLPWTFRLPFKGQHKIGSEPKDHKNGLKRLSKAIFEYSGDVQDNYLEHFKDETQIQFEQSHRTWLTLVFDHARKKDTKNFENLRLTIVY